MVPSPSSRRGALLIAPGITLATYLFYATVVGFDGWLFRDQGLYFYAGLQVAEGYPPYTTAFDIKAPLSSMLIAGAVRAARWTGIPELAGARILFALAASSASAAIFLVVRRLLHELGPALLAALVPLVLLPWVGDVGMGPRPKVLATSLMAWALYGVAARQWSLAGLAVGLGSLVYQPVGLAGVAMLGGLASVRHHDRARNVVRFTAGVVTPWVGLAIYALATGSAAETFWSVLGVHLTHVGARAQLNPLLGFFEFAAVMTTHPMWFLVFSGLLGLLAAALLPSRTSDASDRVAWRSFVLGAGALVGWFCVEFQVVADAYPILPFCALGVACILAPWLRSEDEDVTGHVSLRYGLLATGLTLTAMMTGLRVQAAEPDLPRQQRMVEEIETLIPDGARPIVIGAPAVLALQGWTNPTRFVILDPGFDAFIDSRHPRGFQGWLVEAICSDAEFLVWGGRIPVFRNHASPWYEQFERAIRDNYRLVRSLSSWSEQDLTVWRRFTSSSTCSTSLQ